MAQNFAFKLAENTPFLAIDGINPELEIAKAQLGLRQANTPLTINDRLFGREMTQDYQAVNPDTNKTEMTTLTNYRPGFFNDLASGYRENATQGFNVNNLAPQNKNWATRIGEGLGTLARFYDKPIGRMAVATGLSMLTDEANPLGEGVKAYVGRQNNMTKDKAYRQGLVNMGVDEAQVNAIPGIMTDDVFSNIARAKQLQDNALYRQDMIDTQRENAETLNNYRMAQLAEDVKQNDIKNAIDKQKLAIELKKLEKGDPVSINNIFALANHFDTLPEVKNFKEIDRQFANVNETYKAYKNGELKANAADQAMVTTLNKILDPTSVVRESEFARTAAGQSAFNRMQGYLDKLAKGGGGLTNAEREDLVKTMKIMRNSAYSTYSNTAQTYTEMANRYGMNPDDIIRYKSSYTDKGEINLSPERQEAAEKLRKNGYSEEEIEEYLNSRGL